MFKICDVLGMPPRHMIREAGPKSKVRAVFKEVSGTKEYQIVMDDRVMDQVRNPGCLCVCVCVCVCVFVYHTCILYICVCMCVYVEQKRIR
jgi:hypothetical protein